MIDTTEGSLFKKSIAIAWPTVIQAVLVNFYAFNDFYFVGKLNTPAATAALSSCFALIIIQFVWVRIVPGGSTTLIAQYTGGKKPERVASIFRQALVGALLASTVLCFVAFFGLEFLANLNNVTPEVGRYVKDYMRILLFGAPAFALMLVVIGTFRARGNTLVPLFFEIFSLIVNTILNYVLVLGQLGAPKMGVEGAAIATLLSRGLPGAIGLVYILRGSLGFDPALVSGAKAKIRDWLPNRLDFPTVLKIGFFDSMSGAIYGAAYLMLNRIAGEIGPAAQGGLGAGLRGIEWIAFAFSDGFMTTSITVVGQNIGAGKEKRALKGAIVNALMSAFCCQLVALLFLFFPYELTALVTSDPPITEHAVAYIKIMGWFMWAVGLEMAFYGAFVGAGRTTVTFFLGFVLNFSRIPIAVGLLFGFANIFGGTLWAAFGLGNAPPLTGTFDSIAWAIAATAVLKACFYGIYLGVRRRF